MRAVSECAVRCNKMSGDREWKCGCDLGDGVQCGHVCMQGCVMGNRDLSLVGHK